MNKHNAKANKTYRQGANQFSDVTEDEFKHKRQGYLEKTLMNGYDWIGHELKQPLDKSRSTATTTASAAPTAVTPTTTTSKTPTNRTSTVQSIGQAI